MDIRFLPPDIGHLDEADVELCVCTFWSDERPLRGLAGLLDWRMGGRLSALLGSGFVQGDAGEQVLVPGRPHVPFEKVLLVGLGPRHGFGEESFRDAIRRVARALEGLQVRRAVVELPGRASGAIEPEQAITLTLECVGTSPVHDAWWLIEEAAAQGRIQQRAAEERRRARAL